MSVPSSASRAMPRIGWLLGCSMWLLPVVFGFGYTSWIGFALIGVLVGRMPWVLFAGGWLLVLSQLDIDADGPIELLGMLTTGVLPFGQVAPLLVLYLTGVAYGIHANGEWLRILHDRRVRGVRMLGWTRSRSQSQPQPQLQPQEAGSGDPAPAAEASLAAEVASDRAAPVTEDTAVPTASTPPATELPTRTVLTSTTLLGMPSGPVDVRTASVDEIAAIPAIGPERAARLVAARETRPITSVDDVVEVLGLSAVDLVRARSYLQF